MDSTLILGFAKGTDAAGMTGDCEEGIKGSSRLLGASPRLLLQMGARNQDAGLRVPWPVAKPSTR